MNRGGKRYKILLSFCPKTTNHLH